jgi:heme-degrading monooxygenase HmoA
MNVFEACRHGVARDIHPSRRVFVATGLASGLALTVQPVSAASQKRSLQTEITISPNRDVATLINVFVVEPDNQDKLIQVLKEGTEALFSKQPGYISASFHKSMDGRRVVNYGQWRSPKDIDAFRSKPEIGEYFKRVRELAQFESMVCDVSYVNRA